MNTQTTARAPGRIKLAALALFGLIAFGGLTAFGLRARAAQQADRVSTPAPGASGKMRVLTVNVERAPAFVEQVLPGNAAAYLETAIYSRTTGYLKRRLVDRGDIVQAGQLLAEIESPEVDDQLLQARATLNESKAMLERTKANESLAKANFKRVERLVKSNAVSSQEFDESDAALKVAAASVAVGEATIVANGANIRRLEDLQKFQKIVAPFSGTITTRNYDAGALVVADSSSNRELFHISQTETLRVSADVPQLYSTSIKVGQQVTVFRREKLAEEFPGKVTRTSGAVDPQTRTLRVEIELPNKHGALLPGMYLQVRFRLETPSTAVRVPGAAVVNRAEGSKVAVVGDGGVVHYLPVTLGRDFGTMIEVIEGLKGGEQLVVRPGDDLPEGTPVESVASGK